LRPARERLVAPVSTAPNSRDQRSRRQRARKPRRRAALAGRRDNFLRKNRSRGNLKIEVRRRFATAASSASPAPRRAGGRKEDKSTLRHRAIRAARLEKGEIGRHRRQPLDFVENRQGISLEKLGKVWKKLGISLEKFGIPWKNWEILGEAG